MKSKRKARLNAKLNVKLSVIVPAYNEEKNIGACLRSLRTRAKACGERMLSAEKRARAQDFGDYEIIVCDGGSVDGTKDIAAKYADKVITQQGRGVGTARNLGAKAARGGVLIFVDSDVVVCHDFLERYNRIFMDKRVVAAGGVVRPISNKLVDKLVYKINQDWGYRLSAKLGFYQLCGNNCAYRRNAFWKAGGFDERLSMMEDTALSMKMGQYGKIVLDKRIWAATKPRRTDVVGYLRNYLIYTAAYVRYFLGLPVTYDYFKRA